MTETYEWEALWISRARLDQELVPPAVKCVKALGIIYVIDQHAAVGAPIESNAKGLEAFLACGIP